MVHFDHDTIEAIARDVAREIGFDTSEKGPAIHIDINERSPMNSVVLSSLDPIVVAIASGAFENPKRIRHLDPEACRESIGRPLFEAFDRLRASFGAPELGTALTVAHHAAWATHALGRLSRRGGRSQQQRRRYQFRVHHGFTDAADAAFAWLWNTDETTFAEIIHRSDACRASHPLDVISG